MVDIKYLRKCGVSAGAYKKIWTKDPTQYSKQQKKLVELLSSRVRDGRDNCLNEWRAYKAIDLACDSPFSQIAPTLIGNILSQNLNKADTLEALKQWGLHESEMFMTVQGPDGQNTLQPNIKLFYEVVIPLVNAYIGIRTAKIFNDRNTSPLLVYEPRRNTSRDRILCDIMTSLVDTVSTWYGYPAILKQAIKQMNKYGLVIAFPREEWHTQQQIVEEEGVEKTITVKEGIRYQLPDPTMMFSDLKYPLTSLNTGTGCKFSGHWHLLSFGDIYDNKLLWNREHIYAGSNWHNDMNARAYLKEYFPCTMKFPLASIGTATPDERAVYNVTNDRDKAVFVAEVFMELCPNDWDLIDRKQFPKGYKHDLWHRFTMTGDDTICWSQPCAYDPHWFMGYDYDASAGRTSSLGLETLPWQTTLGNAINQIILSSKQNLANCTFYDKQMVDAEDIKRLVNSGEAQYRGANYIGYDGFKYGRSGFNPKEAFTPTQLAKVNVAELYQLLPMILNIMERVLQISAQETGTTAAHYQSAKEIGLTASNTSQRLQYTASFVDDGIAAWKRQLATAVLAYKDATFIADVDADIPDVETHLAEMGFKIVSRTKDKISVSGSKKLIKLRLEDFADTERETDNEKAKEIAQVMFQTIGVIAGQPLLTQEIGSKTLLKVLEQAAILAGAPKDFHLDSPTAKPGGGLTPEMIQALQGLQQTIMQAVNDKVSQPAAQASAKAEQEIQDVQIKVSQMEQIVQQLQGIYKIAQANQDKVNVMQQEAAAKIQISQAETQHRTQLEQQQAEAEQQRLNAELTADQQRKNAELAAEQQRLDAETKAQIERDNAAATAKIENDKKLADAKAEAAKTAAANKPKPAAKASKK